MVGRTNTSFSAGGAGTMTLNTNINVNTGGGDKKKGSVSTVGTTLSRARRMKGRNNYLFKKLIGSQETNELIINAQPTFNPPTDDIVSTVNSNPINGALPSTF
jgi:hypothetical protein